ncbi:MAG TPA: choice-of-anchor D domain-containing protein [Tepidisphaeraceae bacterium]|jgi:hypothetical protein
MSSFQGMHPLEPRLFLSVARPNLTLSDSRLLFNQQQNTAGRARYVTLTNTGRAPLTLGSISLAGADASQFTLSKRHVPSTLAPGASASVRVGFAPTNSRVFAATLQVASSDPDTPVASVPLSGLGTTGKFETNEPSLQEVLDTLQIPVNVGDNQPTTSALDGPGPSDEVAMPLLRKAGPGPVRVTLLAAFTWEDDPIMSLGWYRAKGLSQRSLFTVQSGNSQTVNPTVTGTTRFDPGSVTFGLFSHWPIESHGDVFSQDALNTWDHTADNKHKIRFYPFKKSYGRVVPNTYVVAMEEAFNSDFQDAVLVIENVMPYDAVVAPTTLVATPATPTAIDLSWDDDNAYETGYVIERSRKKNGTYETVATLAAGSTSYHDTHVVAGTRYYYRVRAINGQGTSAPSPRAVATA